jgi:hypothetical protein
MTEANRTEDQQIEQLKSFYNVQTLEQLTLIQAAHIERLQAMIPDRPDYQGRRVREG